VDFEEKLLELLKKAAPPFEMGPMPSVCEEDDEAKAWMY